MEKEVEDELKKLSRDDENDDSEMEFAIRQNYDERVSLHQPANGIIREYPNVRAPSAYDIAEVACSNVIMVQKCGRDVAI
ncbi:hypothetical protein RDABS01_022214 [Bienertia sinuspersici]